MDQTDEQLIAECAQGDREAFEELYRRYGGRIASYLYRCVSDMHLAEELCQETFARVWMRAGQCDTARGRFRSWLYQIATNLARTHWRKARRLVFAEAPEAVGISNSPAPPRTTAEVPGHDAMRAETGRLVEQALKKLKPEHRIVIILKYFENMKVREIAALTDCPDGTVKSRLHHGLQQLGDLLKGLGLCEEDVG